MKTHHFISVLLLCMFSTVLVYAQYNLPENKTWVLGLDKSFIFNNNQPVHSSINMNGIKVASANASVSDINGQFLFYTDGSRVLDRSQNFMPNGFPLHSYSASNSTGVRSFITEDAAQGVTVVPMPGDPDKYYIFSLTELSLHFNYIQHQPITSNATDIDGGSLFYSVVDMKLNGGLGDVIPGKKWIQMDSLLTEKAVAVPGNHCNVWLLVHSRDSAIFKAYEITHHGINPVPVLSHAGDKGSMIIRPPGYGLLDSAFNWCWMRGPMAVSPDRKRLAAAYTEGAMVEVYDFDPNTGVVSNAMLLNSGIANLEYAYAVCFSPDNSKLYAAVCPQRTLLNDIWQYDLSLKTKATIINSKTTIAFGGRWASHLKLASNGKIYFRFLDGSNPPPPWAKLYISIIDSPNLVGTACKYIAKADSLILPTSSYMTWSLPGEVAKALPGGDTLYIRNDTALCSGQGSLFLTSPTGYDTYLWDDGSTAAKRSVNTGGVYWSIAKDQCHTRIDSFIVRKIDTTTARIDTYMCRNQESIELDAPAGYTAYLWQDGSADNIYTTYASGIYWVNNINYCTNHIDSFVVSLIDPSFSLGNDTVICDGSSLVISASVPGASYLWQDGSIDNTYTVAHSGTYALTVIVKTCTETHDINIKVRDARQRLGNDTIICNDASIDILLQANAEDSDNITWSDNSHGRSLSVKDTGTYWVTVTGNCFAQDTIKIDEELCNCRLEMPTAFTPNGDGRNDVFRPWIQPGCPIDNFTLYIYNRWGQLVYQTADVSKGWDGLYNGKPCEIATYMYRVVFMGGTKQKEQLFIGDLTLIR